ncbi:MAG: cytochrome P450 [Chroococcidiopsidaceae cyanobacterium CP_BM_RX_35]|nr:cytochrome P450 [Chroococcidiopsidaceae cyanobacterium CP_BM_RX_35]
MKLPAGPQTPYWVQTLHLIAQPTRFLDTCAQRYGDTFTLRVLGLNSPPVVFFSHPQAIQEIFALPARQFDFGKATHVFQPLMGEKSVILQQGRSHQRQRQLLLPPFHGDRLKAYGQLICQITEKVTAQWQVGASISIQQFMSDITLQIILQVVFGINPGWRYQQLQELLSSLLEDVTTPLYSSLFFFPPLQQDLGAWSPWGHFLRRRQRIDDLIYEEIAQRRLETDERTDILTLLMSACDEDGQQMSDLELRDQLVSLLLLGYETTAAALAWAFYLIHSTAPILEQLRQELELLGELNPEGIAQLPYLTAVCQETLRIYPIGLICVPRMVQEPLQVVGHKFDTGTVLVPCIYLAHRREAVYPEPEQFKPERFLECKFSPYEYLPFGGGSRGCIGMAFSMYEMKLVLATILSRFRLSLSSRSPVQPVRRGITIVPAKTSYVVTS